ncbi:Phragmoplast orienting kinesin-1 [Forsythia ovata]|uniref:Phragmoplast orienting kinesin-1 n=1 Tax=Forsythia ovata TaxID=205694 RepID=A0ABD1PKN7_9LAMI
MADKANLSEEIKQLRSHIHLRDGENEVLQDHIHHSLREIGNLAHSLEGSFLQMQRGVEELLNSAYDDAFHLVQETLNVTCNLRSSLEDVMCRTMENDITSFVLQRHMGEFFHKFRRLNLTSNFHTSPLQEGCLTVIDLERGYVRCNKDSTAPSVQWQGDQTAKVSKREIKELALVQDDAIIENCELKRELERKDVLLKGLLFDFSLLQESLCNRKDSKDEIEESIVTLNRVKHELHLKTVQLNDILSHNTKLESRLTEAEQALCISKSELEKVRGTLEFLSEQNAELQLLTKDLYLKKSEAEELLEEQREIVKSLEKERIHRHLSSEKQLIYSMKDIEDDLRRVSLERDQLVEQLCSLQDRLDMACSLADENEAIAVEARQESEVSKMYAEQKEEEVKILENSVAELDCTINVLEKKVHEMGEEIEKHRMIRDSLELELQGLRERLLAVEDLTETMNSDNSSTTLSEDLLSRKLHSRSLELAEALRRIRVLEAEKAGQAKEIEQIKDYISELVLHSEAQASQYQQKYKNLEKMVREVKTDVSIVTSEAASADKEDKSSTRTRRSSSPFRCIASLVQQMNAEKDQEMLAARLRIKELEALAASWQKEVCMLNTRLAIAESMTHDVIRDLLSVKLDITNYANMIDQNQLQKLVEETLQQRQEFITMEREICNLRGQINDLLEERERCISEVNRSKTDLLTTQITVEQLQERDQLLTAQNNMLKRDKTNLQKRVTELDDMVKKPFGMHNAQPCNQPQTNSSSISHDSDLGERLVHSQKVLSRINNQLAQYRRLDRTHPQDKLDRHGNGTKFR